MKGAHAALISSSSRQLPADPSSSQQLPVLAACQGDQAPEEQPEPRSRETSSQKHSPVIKAQLELSQAAASSSSSLTLPGAGSREGRGRRGDTCGEAQRRRARSYWPFTQLCSPTAAICHVCCWVCNLHLWASGLPGLRAAPVESEHLCHDPEGRNRQFKMYL